MGRRKKDSTVEVVPGIYLKQADSSAAWHYYFKVAGNQIRKSSKTRDFDEASRIAQEHYNDAVEKARKGHALSSVSFRKLISSYLERIAGDNKEKYHRETIDRHMRDFFVRFSDVSKIQDHHIDDYIVYRKRKGDVLPQTLNRENVVLRQMFKFAERQRWLDTAPVVPKQEDKHTIQRRPHFSDKEFKHLCDVAKQRYEAFDGDKVRIRAYEARFILWVYIVFLGNTGCRVDESKLIMWRDIDYKDRSITIVGGGKTNQLRILYLNDDVIDALKSLRAFLDFRIRNKTNKVTDDMPVFSTVEGKPVKSFKKGFGELLDAAGFDTDGEGLRHSLTSLRHTFATRLLQGGKSISTRHLAMLMGTSERMIERHYGHDEVRDYKHHVVSGYDNKSTEEDQKIVVDTGPSPAASIYGIVGQISAADKQKLKELVIKT